MSIDSDNSFDISEEGLAIRNENGDLLFYLVTGQGVPYGTGQQKAFYYDELTGNFWRSIGSDSSDWVQMDIGLKNNSILSLGVLDDPECASEIDCGTLPVTFFRSLIELGEL